MFLGNVYHRLNNIIPIKILRTKEKSIAIIVHSQIKILENIRFTLKLLHKNGRRSDKCLTIEPRHKDIISFSNNKFR